MASRHWRLRTTSPLHLSFLSLLTTTTPTVSLMSTIAHLARRGINLVRDAAMEEPIDANFSADIHPFKAFVFVATCVVFLIGLFLISYTLGHVIPTLCMIESPETSVYVPVHRNSRDGASANESTDPPPYTAEPTLDDEEDQTLQETPMMMQSDAPLVLKKPTTSSIMGTIRYLRVRGGRSAPWRGLALYLCWNVLRGIIVSLFAAVWPNTLFIILAVIIANVLLSRWQLAWIHIVISEPSEKRWYRRLPARNTFLKIAPAVAIWATAHELVAVLPMLITGSFGSMKNLKDPNFEPGKKDAYVVGAQGFLGFFLTLVLYVLLQIPATVTVVRVAASMLPEEEETIIPFDRTFGGKTTPTIIGGQGKIGIVEAWTSYTWASRMRLLKLVAKVVLIAMALWVVFTMVLVAEAHILFGENLGKVLRSLHGVAGPR